MCVTRKKIGFSLCSRLYDGLNDWKPERAANYREHAEVFAAVMPGVIARDGLLLDGWPAT